jgi:hypothetical protein
VFWSFFKPYTIFQKENFVYAQTKHMRQIGFKKSGADSKIQIPVWMINDRELWLIYCAFTKMKIYVPELMIGDVQRINDMLGKIGDYLGLKKEHQKRIIKKLVRTGMLDEWINDPNAFDHFGRKIEVKYES